jgi:lipopolysaccharide/colanic/teichoic acid biosynthesis glycosyltransferase
LADAYARAISEYPIRHRVKPGITGWAQVNDYVENWSVTFDLLILGRTFSQSCREQMQSDREVERSDEAMMGGGMRLSDDLS